MGSSAIRSRLLSSTLAILAVVAPGASLADGILRGPILPGGRTPRLFEMRQEAIIIHDPVTIPDLEATEDVEALRMRALEDLILRISVQSLEEIETFSWVIPFPNPPQAVLEDPKVFEEIRRHVTEHGVAGGPRSPRTLPSEGRDGESRKSAAPEAHVRGGSAEPPRTASQSPPGVEIISQTTAGTYDVTVVRAGEKGALDAWLEKEGFRSTQSEGEDVVELYRKKGYVFACVKVSGVKLAAGKTVELEPLRFTFQTGGRDGVYFPMKMTSLQKEPFDLDLHIFAPTPIDEDASKYGYAHRGLHSRYREEVGDLDPPKEGASASAASAPESDRRPKGGASALPSLAELFERVRPEGRQLYLTSIGARGMRPEALESWADDLWVFPRYAGADFVPFDARPGGPAAAGWAEAARPKGEGAPRSKGAATERDPQENWPFGVPIRHVDIEGEEDGSGP